MLEATGSSTRTCGTSPVNVSWKLLQTRTVEPYIVRTAAVKFGLHAGNMKSNTHQDEQFLRTILYYTYYKYNLVRNSILNLGYVFRILMHFSENE